MKKMIVTAASILVVTGTGISYAANASTNEQIGEHEPVVSKYNDVSTIQNLAEYKTLNDMMAINHFEPEIVEDTVDKRVIILKNRDGEEKYKSIYMKQSNRLKVVDFNRGVVVDQMIQPDHQQVEVVFPDTPKDQSVVNDLQSFKEYEVLSERLPIEKLEAEVIENNQHKRVILFSKEGKEQYKSIYVERSNRLKIVDFSQGLLFNETLHGAEVVQDEKQTETAQKEKGTQQEKAAPIVEQPSVTKESKTVQAPKKKETVAQAPKQEKATSTKEQVKPKAETNQTAEKQAGPKQSSHSNIQEMATINKQVNMEDLTTQVVEDNAGKRIMVLKDGNGKPQYKSIYVKRNRYLKIIKMRGGVVFNGQI
ncbi:MAG TPA: hypothetical protein VK120_02030 [Sporosarcina sp.]|nr:hypothetical protein [Sporosarcina sp.]